MYSSGGQARRFENKSQTCFPEGEGLGYLGILKKGGLRLGELGGGRLEVRKRVGIVFILHMCS